MIFLFCFVLHSPLIKLQNEGRWHQEVYCSPRAAPETVTPSPAASLWTCWAPPALHCAEQTGGNTAVLGASLTPGEKIPGAAGCWLKKTWGCRGGEHRSMGRREEWDSSPAGRLRPWNT